MGRKPRWKSRAQAPDPKRRDTNTAVPSIATHKPASPTGPRGAGLAVREPVADTGSDPGQQDAHQRARAPPTRRRPRGARPAFHLAASPGLSQVPGTRFRREGGPSGSPVHAPGGSGQAIAAQLSAPGALIERWARRGGRCQLGRLEAGISRTTACARTRMAFETTGRGALAPAPRPSPTLGLRRRPVWSTCANFDRLWRRGPYVIAA